MITKEHALQIANDVGVSSRPIQFWQGEIKTILASEGYVYIGYLYCNGKDVAATSSWVFSLYGVIIGEISPVHHGGGTFTELSNTVFSVFDSVVGSAVGRCFFSGYRIVK